LQRVGRCVGLFAHYPVDVRLIFPADYFLLDQCFDPAPSVHFAKLVRELAVAAGQRLSRRCPNSCRGRAYGRALQALRPFRREHHAQDSTDGLADVMHSIELKGVEKAFHVVDQFVN
jgi:hypothetical protein